MSSFSAGRQGQQGQQAERRAGWIVLPHQLFDVRRVWIPLWRERAISEVVVLEDACFWGHRKGSSAGRRTVLPLNPLRLAYQRLLLDAFKADVVAVAPAAAAASLGIQVSSVHALSDLDKLTEWWICDPVDELFEKKLRAKLPDVHVVDTPMFVASRADLEAYTQRRPRSRSRSHSVRLQHRAFFEWMKARYPHLHVLGGIGSTDAENRVAWHADRDPVPPAPWNPTRFTTPRAAAEQAMHWALQQQPTQWSPEQIATWVDILTHLPLRPPAARAWLQRFLRERLRHFGTYQDAIVSGEPYMFHSGISPFLNFGLLLPAEVLRAAAKHAAPSVPINAYEAFVRQILGWREYSRLYYRVVPPSIWRQNALQAKGTLAAEWWSRPARTPDRTPASSLPPIVTEAIADAWSHGYLHHIRRLMVVANWMTLSGVHPDDMFDWFSAFALDAHEWVMVFNVYGMGSFADGGHASRKPYVSSAAYLLRMSDATDGPWADAWRAKYAAFCARVKRCGR